jgi:hypothetical protein
MKTRSSGRDVHKADVHGFAFAPGERGTHFRFDNTLHNTFRRMASTLRTTDSGSACTIGEAVL